MKLFKKILLSLGLCVGVVWANNTSLFIDTSQNDPPRLIAHRGVHQIYAGSDRTNETCRVNPIKPLTHTLIENTLPSIEAAFQTGADVVEVDVHLTTDDVFAVYHDWRLECQTDGAGVTHKQDFANLQTLDLGYGYSVDGKTFPLRGTAVGMMPSLAEVLTAKHAGQILVNFKGERAKEGQHLTQMLQDDALRARVFGVYGGGPPTKKAISGVKDLRGFDRSGLIACLKTYVLIGWSGHVPKSCTNKIIAIPSNYAPFVWGWPHRFTQRMKSAGTDVILWGPYDGSGFSSGVDTIQHLEAVPNGFDGYVWTNKIEVIGPIIKGN